MPRNAAVMTLVSLRKPEECHAQWGRKSLLQRQDARLHSVVQPKRPHTEQLRRKAQSHNMKHKNYKDKKITTISITKNRFFLKKKKTPTPPVFKYFEKTKAAFYAASKSISQLCPMPEGNFLNIKPSYCMLLPELEINR